MESAVDAGAIPAEASAILMAAVGGDAGKIPTLVSAVASAVDVGAIPAETSVILMAAVGGDAGKVPTVGLAMYAAADVVAIPVAAVVGDMRSESIAAEDNTINGMMQTMMWDMTLRLGMVGM